MNALEFFETHYKNSEYFEKFKTLFPSMYNSLSQIQVIPWRYEFQVRDKNPEVITILEYYNALLNEGKISREEYEEITSQQLKDAGFVSRTEGISFRGSKEVSFRTIPPSIFVFFHEVGHVYFDVDDHIWSAIYGGAEVLFWLLLQGRIHAKKPLELVQKHIQMLEHLEVDHKGVESEILAKLRGKFKTEFLVADHLGNYMTIAGHIPDEYADVFVEAREKGIQEESKEFYSLWGSSKELVREFLDFVIDGVKWGDTFGKAYFEAIYSEYL